MMIFEDSDNAPISQFLKKVFGEEVIFSSSNSNLHRCIERYARTEKCVLVFLDYVYDNRRTYSVYRELEFYEDIYSNVFIVKIPCIEYIALLTLIDMGIVRDTNLVNKFVESTKHRVVHEEKSYEKFCKKVLNSYKLSCVHNKLVKGGIKGSFWVKGCGFSNECRHIVEAVGCTGAMYTLKEKIKFFVYSLPCFYVDNPEFGSENITEYKSIIDDLNNTRYGYITAK